MAGNRGRDLKFSILSDTDKLDLREPADDLEDLGKSAGEAGRDLEAFQRDADKAARDVDGAFDKIAKSSRSNMRKVDGDLERGERALGEFKDEAGSSGREAAASFSGEFDDVSDLIQETAANAFGGFGPAGAAAGVLAAAGIGVIANALTQARERARELKNSLLDVRIEDDGLGEVVKVILDDLKDNGELARLAGDARRLGVDWKTLVRAMAGSQPDLEAVNRELDGIASSGYLVGQTGDQAQLSFQRLSGAVGRAGTAMSESTQEARAYVEGLDSVTQAELDAKQALEDHAAAIDAFADPVSTYTGLLADKAAAEGEAAESVRVTTQEYLAALEEQVTAQEDWAANLVTLAERGVSQGVLAQLERMGPEGAPLVAQLTTASDKELAKLASLFQRQGEAAATNVAQSITDAKPRVATAAQGIRDKAESVLDRPIRVPVNVQGPPQSTVWQIRQSIQRGLDGITVAPAIVRAEAQSRYRP